MMKKRTALLTSLFVFALILTSSQLFLPVAGANHNPMTAPLTSFVRKISGQIKVKHFTFKHFSSRLLPASGVTVKLLNVKTHDMQTAQTDANGVYTFYVSEKGWYEITPKINHATADIVAPPFRFVTVNKNDKLHEDFQAIDLP